MNAKILLASLCLLIIQKSIFSSEEKPLKKIFSTEEVELLMEMSKEASDASAALAEAKSKAKNAMEKYSKHQNKTGILGDRYKLLLGPQSQLGIAMANLGVTVLSHSDEDRTPHTKCHKANP